MKDLTFVDADAHVEECEEIWNFLDPEYQPRRPVAVTLDRAPGRGNLNAFWKLRGPLPQTWVAHFEANAARGLDGENQFLLGGDTGLRGYRSKSFTGSVWWAGSTAHGESPRCKIGQSKQAVSLSLTQAHARNLSKHWSADSANESPKGSDALPWIGIHFIPNLKSLPPRSKNRTPFSSYPQKADSSRSEWHSDRWNMRLTSGWSSE
jgi:hypothetical protein